MAKKGDISPQQKAILDGMLAQNENRECADCRARGPRWASVSVGVFICMRCAGIHRSLGTHITKVKSVNLDKWSDDQLQFIQTMGNAKANAIYEANLPDHYRRPNENDGFGIERFIRDKYERKAFVSIQNVPTKPKKSQQQPHAGYQQQPPQQQYAPQYHAPPQPQPAQNLVNFDAFNSGPPAQPPQQHHHHQPQGASALPVLAPPPGSGGGYHQQQPFHHQQQQPSAAQQQTEFGAFQSAGPAKSGNEFDNFFNNAGGAPSAESSSGANQPPPPSKDALLSMYNRPIAPTTNVPSGPNYNIHPTPPAMAVPPGYVAVMNPMVPGGIMFVPAAGVYGAAPGGVPQPYGVPAAPGGYGAPAYGGSTPSGFNVAPQPHPAAPANPNNNASFANLTQAYMGPGKR